MFRLYWIAILRLVRCRILCCKNTEAGIEEMKKIGKGTVFYVLLKQLEKGKPFLFYFENEGQIMT